ncbi:MAG: dipeptidyl-peptidase-4 [Verrucomicrobiales bacterium]|jgi:dipeptidyl-peptidase-4
MNRGHFAISISLLITLTAPLGHVCAQGSKADYARADNLRKQVSGKVFRDQVTPNWIDSQDASFWYRLRTAPDQQRFVLVDSEKQQRGAAFDHDALASALTEATGREVAAHNLPFRSFDFIEDGAAIEFLAKSIGYRFDLESETVTEIKLQASANGTTVPVLPSIRTARSNRENGDSTEITFINKTDEALQLFWVNNTERPTPYGSLAAGERLDQHTYAGHVWLAQGANGKSLGVFEATARAGIAVIDGTWKPAKDQEKPRRRDRRRSVNSTSPDGRWQATIRDHNVVIVDTSTHNESTLTESGTNQDPFLPRFYWSPDSQHLATIQEKQAEPRTVHLVESSPEDQLQPRLHSFDYVKPGDPLDHPRPRMFNIATRSETVIDDHLFANPWRLSEFRWSADSTRFSFLYNQRGHQVFRLVAVEADTGTISSLIEETPETFVCYSSKSFYRPIEASNEIIWMSERDGWNHLYLFDSRTGKLKNQITRGSWVVRKVDRIDTENRQIWFQAGGVDADQDPYHLHHCRINFDGTDLVQLTQGDGTHSIEFSPDGQYLIDTFSRVDLPPVTELRRAIDGTKVMDLENADASALTQSGWHIPERFTAKGRDGETDIWGVIYRPSNFDPNQHYPVIEKIYAGPHSAHVPKSFSTSGSAMAELGFIVVQIDGMGTSYRSKAFHDVCWQNIGDSGFPDRILWIKAAARTRPWMDLTRVGIYGGSAGGQNAMRALIAHHDFYHVAVADCGCHDNRMDKIWWNEQWMGYPIAEHYAASSNVDQAYRMQGKLMLIVGEQDRNVDPASTMQVANALIKADKNFDLVIIPGAGHGAAGTPYGKRRQRDFFVRHLLDVEPRHAP